MQQLLQNMESCSDTGAVESGVGPRDRRESHINVGAV